MDSKGRNVIVCDNGTGVSAKKNMISIFGLGHQPHHRINVLHIFSDSRNS